MNNFKNITERYKIQIPIIQRDYAQGRTDRKSSQIREGFLNSIYEALDNNNVLHLDFIYGSVEGDKFIPLDGQQRLTTLFLLYCYFGKKENKDINYLKNFTYKTRASSREFSAKLVGSEIDFSDINISKQIKDSSWFLAYWEYDPTIQAMLTMIDAIHSKFYTKSFYDKLDNITFKFFELKKFGLDDDLYIKMNARGKSLTDFENFKAKFEKHLSQIDEDLKKLFSHKIDNNWTDFFWKYGVDDETYLIDGFFMNYFNYITEMLHYKISKKTITENIDYEQIKTIYTSKVNIKFLFQSLDKLPSIINSFKELFSKDEYEENKVCLFDNETNLLVKIILGRNTNIQQKILLFIIINHSVNSEINDSLKDLLRISRNLTHRIKHLKRGFINYTNDLSFENIHSLLEIFLKLINKDIYSELTLKNFERSNSGISKKSLQFEVDKAIKIQNDKNIKQRIFRLEDFKHTKGDIHNFLVSDVSELDFYNNSIREIFVEDDSSIIRSMLTIDDYSLYIGWTMLGNKYFFGKESNWEVILTASNKFNFFKEYLESYKSKNNSLDEIISSYMTLNADINRDWKYYFIKYPEMTSTVSSLSSDNNIYAWKHDFSIEKMGGKNLNAYHLNPYINTVANNVNANSIDMQYGDLSYCSFNNTKVYSSKNGWKIHNFNKANFNKGYFKKVCTKYDLIKKDKYYLLKETKDKDRIEILSELLTEIKENEAY
jgi:hypothetical protein